MRLFSLLGLTVLITSCSQQPTAEIGEQPPANNGATTAEQDHGKSKPLGKINADGHSIEVIQYGDVEPGSEAAFDLMFESAKPLPQAVRAWIGIESGVGSMKSRLAKEGEHTVHGHVEVPATLPDGSKLWIEVETDGNRVRVPIAWQ